MLFNTGSFTGTATARSITGNGFQPDLVLAKNLNTTGDTWFRTADMPASNSAPIRSDAGLATTRISSLDADGFSVGTSADVNGSGNTIVWVAMKDDGKGDFATFTFTGDAADDKLVFSAFQPDFALIKSSFAIVGAMKFAAESSATGNQSSNAAIPNYQGTGKRSDLMYFGADGLRVSNGDFSGGNLVNRSAVAHYGFALKNVPGFAAVGSYTGNGTNDTPINVGLQPAFIVAHRDDAGEPVVQYQAQMSSGNTAPWDGTQVTGKINSLTSTSFLVGTNSNINGSGFTYYFLALALRAPSAAQGNFLRVF